MNRYDVPQAFLVVFRLGGALVKLRERMRVNGRPLFLHVVDLAPAVESGSRSKSAPVVVTEAQLLDVAE